MRIFPYFISPPTSRFQDDDDDKHIIKKTIFADFHLLKREIRSRLWFSYRKDFPAIGDSGMTSDRGWGCMLRCGQMVVAESLQR